ncbi:MAG: enoyl-CoA hydratase/carnithine racemase [Bermanella sp.]|jgi:enoyl-CoA hydratase/carnithine racemase
MPYNTLNWVVEDRVLTLTLNRPEYLNALTVEMFDELEHAFRRASEDDSVGAVIVTGAGSAFSAGMDLSTGGNVFGLDESLQPTLADIQERLEEAPVQRGVRDIGGRVTLAIYDCKKPVIAAINGVAVGGGATLLSAMDVRLASKLARIGFVFGKLGVVPESCVSWFLPRIVGMSQALEWMYSAEIMDANAAREGGLVRSVHEPEQLLAAANNLARKFIDNRSPVATALARQMLYRNAAATHPMQAHQIESLGMFYTSRNEGREGVGAFLEKRAPRFSARASVDMPPFYDEWLAQNGAGK